MPTRFIPLAVAAVAFLAAPVSAQSSKGLKAGLDSYEKSAKTAKDGMVKDVDDVLDVIRRKKGDPALVERHLNEVKRQKERFERSDDLPTHDDLLGPTLNYLDRLRKARAELNRVYKQETDAARRAKDDDRLSQLVREKATFDEQVAGRKQFESKSEWNGTRYGAKGGGIDVRLTVGKAEDNAFRGQFWQDTDSSEKFGAVVEGVLDGNEIKFKMTKVLDGKPRALSFSGYVFENRMILRVSGTTWDGKPANGVIDFRKK